MDVRPYISTLILILAYILFFRKVRKHPIILIYYIYLASAVSSIFLDYQYLEFFGWSPQNYYYYGYISFGLCNVIALLPILQLRNYSPLKQSFKITKRIQYFLLFWFILALYSIIYHMPYVINTLKTSAAEIRHVLNAEKKSILPENYFTTLAVAIAAFYNFFIFMFFRILVDKPKYFKILFFCIISSVTYVISSLTFGARDGLLFYVLSTSFAYLLHKSAFEPRIQRKVFRLIFFFGIIFVFVIGRFTYQRFIQSAGMPIEEAVKVGVIGYFGQQPYVFNEAILHHEKTGKWHGYSLRFPVLKYILGDQDLPKRNIPVEWSFGSYLKDLYDVAGFPFLFFFIACFSCFFYYHFGKWEYYHPLRNIMLISFYWQFLISGLFFFNLGTFAGNVTILTYLSSFYIIKYIYTNKINEE
jgi:hypothetical protein